MNIKKAATEACYMQLQILLHISKRSSLFKRNSRIVEIVVHLRVPRPQVIAPTQLQPCVRRDDLVPLVLARNHIDKK